MDRAKYNACMRPYMTGSKSKEQRQMDFCIGAKLCSGKTPNEEAAKAICSLPKEPKPLKVSKRSKGKSCEKEVLEVAHCMVDKIDMDRASNINSIETAIVNAMMECQCPSEK